jgi:serine/threonine-protein kinase RsbT
VKALAQQAGLSLVNLTKLVTAASEIARNALVYGRGGLAKIEQLKLGTQEGVRVTISDNGPGIQDVEQALVDGFSSGRGMGLGLSGAKRLCDEFNIQTSTGHGTTVVITKWI